VGWNLRHRLGFLIMGGTIPQRETTMAVNKPIGDNARKGAVK
jgi:hypothetical protein